MNYNEFKRTTLGNSFDYDHVYGAQCVDYIDTFWGLVGYPIIWCNISGYAKDIWESRNTNGVLKNHIEVEVMQPGDIVVFKETPSTPYSHIAFFDHDNGDGTGAFLGQNQGSSVVNLITLPYSATYPTAFRPKCWINNTVSTKSQEAVDDILHTGSYVTSKPMKIGDQGLATIGGQLCAYLTELGGWFPIEYVSEFDASDGAKDNYLATTKAKVTVDRCKVEAVDTNRNVVKIHDIWVKCDPLIEVG